MICHRKLSIAQSFPVLFLKSLPQDHQSDAKSLLEAYSITSSASDDEAFASVLQLANDICFHAPTMAIANSWKGDSYVYFFNEPNPRNGPYKGEATHVLDVAYLFQNFNDQLPAAQQGVASAFAGDFVKFITGEAPWSRYDANKGGVKIYDVRNEPAATFTTDMSSSVTKRRAAIFEHGFRIGLDNITDVWNGFFVGN
jgi:carboxylesterase type B